MDISIITQDKQFAALKQDWQILLANSPANSLFCSWDLAWLFWQVYGKQAQLRIICVHRHNQLIAIFPLYIGRRRLLKLFNLRTLQWLGTGGDTSPDYLGGIVHNHYLDHYQSLLADGLRLLREQWDLCDLRDMSTPLSADPIRQRLRGELLHAGTQVRDIIVAELKPDWDAYLGELSSNRRQQIRRARRKLFEPGQIQLDRLSGAGDLDSWFDALVRLHHKRWQDKGEAEHAFRTTEYNTFHRQLMARMLDNNALRLWGLRKGDELIAVLYCLSDGHSTYYFQGGFDTDYDELKPGMVLMSCAMEEAIKEGCDIFNMMKGDYDFKRSLAKQQDQTHSALLVANTLSGWVYVLRFVWLPRLRRALRF